MSSVDESLLAGFSAVKEVRDRGRGDSNGIAPGSEGPHPPDMNLITFRLKQHDSYFAEIRGELTGIHGQLCEIKASIAALPTRDTVRNWGIIMVEAIVGSLLTLGAIFVNASNNQLSAFQMGLSAVQTGVPINQAFPK